jgi:MFS family permease
MYQAIQNILVGLGAVSGASLGGVIAVEMGWRWCFALQVPVSLLALAVGYAVLRDPPPPVERMAQPTKGIRRLRSVLARLDVSGSLVLVLALSAQLAGLSLGGNEFAWSSTPVIASLVVSFVLLAVFLVIEAKTRAFPIIPLEMLKGYKPLMVQLTNIFAGMAAYAVGRTQLLWVCSADDGSICSWSPSFSRPSGVTRLLQPASVLWCPPWLRPSVVSSQVC